MIFNVATVAAVAAFITSGMAQTPANSTICDYYTTALLKNNTAENQLTLLTLVVNTAVIGNYTKPNVGIAVPGILAPGTVNGTKVNLLGYFNGSLVSSNRNGVATSVNFLDDGGAVPLTMNKPANGTNSNQYRLLTHLYSYFGAALGCSTVGNTSFPAYAGQPSQYSIHKYMDLSDAEVTWFIMNVGLSAASFGVAPQDVTAVGTLLTNTFGRRCAPAATVIPAQGAQLQAICIDSSCPQAASPNCSAYDTNLVKPATTTVPTGTGTTSAGGGSGTGTAAASPSGSGSAGTVGTSGLLAGIAALFALVL